MPRPDQGIDIQDSDGSSEDSYDSDNDSAGSLREFIVEGDCIEDSDYSVSTEESLSTLSDSDTEQPPMPPRRRPVRRAVRDRQPLYVLANDEEDDTSGDEEYQPAQTTLLEFEIVTDGLRHLNNGVQRFLQE